MESYVNGYNQVRIFLSMKEVGTLERKGELIGSTIKVREDRKRTVRKMRLYICDNDIPREDELRQYDKRRGYELYISKRRVKMLKKRNFIDAVSPRKMLRSMTLSLEGVI